MKLSTYHFLINMIGTFSICICVPLIPAHFFISFFVLNSNPIVDIIVNHLYILLLPSHKINTKYYDKNKKNPMSSSAWPVRSVARNIVVSKELFI